MDSDIISEDRNKGGRNFHETYLESHLKDELNLFLLNCGACVPIVHASNICCDYLTHSSDLDRKLKMEND